MAMAVINTRTDQQLVVTLHEALTSEPLTPLREQLLDVIRTNADALFGYKEQDDDDD